MKVIKWIIFLPIYWIALGIVWILSSLVLQWASSLGGVGFWLIVPEVFLIGGGFSIGIIYGIIDSLKLSIKPALIVLLINILIGIIWTLNNGGYSFENVVDVFGIFLSTVSLIGIIILFFTKKKE